MHLAFFSRTPAEIRMRILEGRRRAVEERREGLRAVLSRAGEQIDRYTRELHQLGLDTSEREVRWLNELIQQERAAHDRPDRTERHPDADTRENNDQRTDRAPTRRSGSPSSASATAPRRSCRASTTTATPTRRPGCPG